MIERNTPSDPRLRERRGDLTGRGALLFTLLLLAAFGAVAYLLLVVLEGGAAADPTPFLAPSTAPASSMLWAGTVSRAA